jgi:hypothetical protein
MSNYFTLQIYVICIIFTIIYDVFFSNGVNILNYDKHSMTYTIISLFCSFIWGLLIFLANYHNFNILSWVLLIYAIFSFILVIIFDQLYINLHLQDFTGYDKKY